MEILFLLVRNAYANYYTETGFYFVKKVFRTMRNKMRSSGRTFFSYNILHPKDRMKRRSLFCFKPKLLLRNRLHQCVEK